MKEFTTKDSPLVRHLLARGGVLLNTELVGRDVYFTFNQDDVERDLNKWETANRKFSELISKTIKV